MKEGGFFKINVVVAALSIATMVTAGWCQSTMTVNLDGATTVIPKEIFGTLMERLNRCITGGLWVGTSSTVPNTNGMRNDIIDGMKECGLGAIEWPGGCESFNYVWNPPNPENDLGTDRFMQLCQLVGCEPILVGPGLSSAASNNLAWVTYVNNNASHPEWNLKYFKVGNEVWGCGGNQTEASYAPNYLANYNILKNPVNGKKLFLTASTGLTGNFVWMDSAARRLGSSVDGLEYHDYVFGDVFWSTISCVNFSDNDYYNIMYRIEVSQIAARYKQITDILNKYDPNHRIKIIWDEWGDWFVPLDKDSDNLLQQNTVFDALSAAGHLNFFMSHADRIQMTGIAQVTNVIHSLFLTESAQGRLVKTPSFYVFKLFKPHHTLNAKLAPVTTSSIQTITGNGTTMPVLTTATSINDSGDVNISLSNIDLTNSRPITITLTKSNVQSYTVSSASIVTGPAKNSYNPFGGPEAVNIQPFAASNYSITGKTLNVTLPKISVVMLTLKPSTTALPGNFHGDRQDAFSIRMGKGRTVIVTSTLQKRIPVTISMFGVDGRTLIDKVSRTFEPGRSTCVLDRISGGVYIVKIAGPDIDLSKPVVIGR